VVTARKESSFGPSPSDLTQEFFCRPAEEVAPELIGYLLLIRQESDIAHGATY